MGQIKVYGIRDRLNPMKETLSNVIHSCMVEVLEFPSDKKFHRFSQWRKKIFIMQMEELKRTL